MIITLRPYQQKAVDLTINWIKKTLLPCVVEMSVGAGKSIYIAEVARQIHDMSGKRVLCIAPRAELVLQNAGKFRAIEGHCSIFSASAGEKSLRHKVIFATPLTFKPVAKRLGHEFAAIIIDECEGVTAAIKQIILDMKQGNPNLRIIGTTGTPFTTRDGLIYAEDEHGRATPPDKARDPYYHKLLMRVTTRELIDAGFLTKPTVGDTGREKYDAGQLKPNRGGNFDPKDVDKVFVGHGRKTALIVADAMHRMKGRRAIVFFAATLRHAEEILASLNSKFAAIVSGKTANRREVLKRFADGELRVLVNVNVLTVGWDCPSVDGIVLMRATESARLLTQIVGRALRLCPGKTDALLLDYAQNFERHAPDGDIFNLTIKQMHTPDDADPIECKCEKCGRTCLFSPRKNEEGYGIDENGYFVDLLGKRIETETNTGELVPMPAHFGRRCQHVDLRTEERCDYYWSCKKCPACEFVNDIAARFCKNCKAELVNPNDKLLEIFKAHKKDPTLEQCDRLISISYKPSVSRAGNAMHVAQIITENRKFNVYLMDRTWYLQKQKDEFRRATKNFTSVPKSISYKKEGDFYRVTGFGAKTDAEILEEKQNWIRQGRRNT